MALTIAQGIALEAKAEALQAALLRQGRKRWSEPDAITLQAVRSITDISRLERMFETLLEANSWMELLNKGNERGI
jgi:hypothetical protein